MFDALIAFFRRVRGGAADAPRMKAPPPVTASPTAASVAWTPEEPTPDISSTAAPANPADALPQAGRGRDLETDFDLTPAEVANGCEKVIEFERNDTCETCGGRGTIPKVLCPSCHGNGRCLRKRIVVIAIPPGIRDGMCVRIRGEGESGELGGQRGDLYCYMNVKRAS